MRAQLPTLLPPLCTLARRTSDAIMAIYQGQFQVTEKADSSPLTAADMAAHRMLLAGLEAILPGVPVISEEAPAPPLAERQHWPCLWLVDPLDGTKGFVRRNGEFCINIALIENHVPVLGLIMAPVSGMLYYAHRGGGAHRQDPQGHVQAIHTRRPCPPRPMVAGSRHPGERLRGVLARLGEHDYVGKQSALKSCLVAEGQVDLHVRFGHTGEWDTAAAQILVEEAGGALTDHRMLQLRYNTRETLINPEFLVFGDPEHDWLRYLPT